MYNAYKAHPSADALQKIESMIQETNQELPALLQAAHISDPALSARISAAVNLILTSVSSFASLIPQASPATRKTARQNTVIPRPTDLKQQWNQQVCAPSGNAVLDDALRPVISYQFSVLSSKRGISCLYQLLLLRMHLRV
jgi:hypothetical protein